MTSIEQITLSLPLFFGTVNCYLVQIDDGFVLIDSGSSNQRRELLARLDAAGCTPGSLKLVILTHGDFDHSGNAAELQARYRARVALHRDDVGMVEKADMFWNRKQPIFLIRMLVPVVFGFGRTEVFSPDFQIHDGYDFSSFGFDARAIALPGHSKGSIGILTGDGDLFCGDLLENRKTPALYSMIDDQSAANESVAKLRELDAGTVYPGHGKPFPLSTFLTSHAADIAPADRTG